MLGSEVNLHVACGNDDIVMVVPTVDLTADISIVKDIRNKISQYITWRRFRFYFRD